MRERDKEIDRETTRHIDIFTENKELYANVIYADIIFNDVIYAYVIYAHVIHAHVIETSVESIPIWNKESIMTELIM